MTDKTGGYRIQYKGKGFSFEERYFPRSKGVKAGTCSTKNFIMVT
jgi:hypothetical protein